MPINEINEDIFNLLDPQPTPGRGSLLVAKPTVEDSCFKRSVIVLVDNDTDKGSMGLIANLNTGYVLSDVINDVPGGGEIPLYLGGPVGTNMLFLLHRLGPEAIPGSVQVSRGLWFGGDFEALRSYMATGGQVAGLVKFVMGYSGWEAGQLSSELDRHDWAVLKGADPVELLEQEGDGLWRWAVSSFGPKYASWLHWPRNVGAN